MTARPDPNDTTLNKVQKTEPPVPAEALSLEELKSLGLWEGELPLPHERHLMAPQIQAQQGQAHGKIQTFVQQVLPAATQAANELKVPVEAVISQWALESGWGQSELARKYNNLGGIKALGSGWQGGVVRMPSAEKDQSVVEVSPFRTYPDLNAYAQDYISTLSHDRYSLVRGTNDVKSFGEALTKAGYSQDSVSSYTNSLESIAKRVRPFIQQQDF